MAKRRQCARCGTLNAVTAKECKDCGQEFSAQREERRYSSPATCAWDDHGRRCACRGILSLSTSGDGPWYCREHWDAIQGRTADVIGNALPAYGGTSATAKWTGWWETWKDSPARHKLANPLDVAA